VGGYGRDDRVTSERKALGVCQPQELPGETQCQISRQGIGVLEQSQKLQHLALAR
jgi:hypothetical protein